MAKKEATRDYRNKRDFRRTSEPSGRASSSHDEPLFVIHKHDARRLHYDFRLEVDGVLKSWAVPKGPSTDPREKRLAVAVDDHPLDYAEFEGVIPEGEYGAGTVLIWDAGTYRSVGGESESPLSMSESIASGHVKVWLEGEKLRGGYALTRFKKGQEENWLLVKMDDGEADARRNPVSTQPESAASGRTLEEIAKQER
jgi:DNA ligase D-like protein (predicted 3'-phosphoesterase)